ncbi:hypothetical protein NXG04_07715 [Klebsiella pneumoniae]|nr:hypothetical protein [Klebsiella pneumoniae]MDS7714441.1 hypothetical protein [Klebsiella pneumoniae]
MININETETVDTLYTEIIGDYKVEINLMRIYTSRVGLTRYYNEYYDLRIIKRTKRLFWFDDITEVFNIKWNTDNSTLTQMIHFAEKKIDMYESERVIS